MWSVYIDPVKAADNPWNSNGLEWQTATPVPWFDFERIPVVLSDPYHYGEPEAPPVADLGVLSLANSRGQPGPSARPRRRARRKPRSPSTDHVSRGTMADRTTSTESIPMLRETPEEVAYELRAHEGALWTGSRMVIGIWALHVRGPGLRLLLPAIGEQRQPLASCPYHGAHRRRRGDFAFSLASAALVTYGMRRFRLGYELDWQVAGWTGILCTLTAVALQVWQLTVLPFFPGSSG